MSQKRKQKQKYLKLVGPSLTLFAIFSFRNGFMMAKMPLNIRGSFTTWTALIRMGKPSCEGREGDVRTYGVFANCLLPQPASPVKPSVWSDSQDLLKETQVGAKQEGKKWSEPTWMDLVTIRAAPNVFLRMLQGVM